MSIDPCFPCFGFPTAQEVKAYADKLQNEDKYGEGNSHCETKAEPLDQKKIKCESQANWKVTAHVLTKIVACLPFAGQIIGFKRLTENSDDPELTPSGRAQHFVRGVAECFGLGILMIIVDLIIFAVRSIFENNQTDQPVKA